MLQTEMATTGRAQPGVSYGRCRGVLTDTGTACNHQEIWKRIGPRTTRYGGRTRAGRLLSIGAEGHHFAQN